MVVRRGLELRGLIGNGVGDEDVDMLKEGG